MVFAGFRDFQPFHARRAHPRVESAAEDRRLEVSTHVPEPGAIRHRLGRSWSGYGLLRLRPTVLAVPETVSRSAHCLAPTSAGKTCLDDFRNHQGAVADIASWTA